MAESYNAERHDKAQVVKKTDDKKIFSFPPSSSSDALLLILGSMPGGESLRKQQYYAHPQNKFWDITGHIFDFSKDSPYEERLNALRKNKIALWDVVHSCHREGSMDSDIHNVEVNDFESFFKKHRHIRKVFFNGQTAQRLFIRHTAEMKISELELCVLPSSSPANASIPFEKKYFIWRNLLSVV